MTPTRLLTCLALAAPVVAQPAPDLRLWGTLDTNDTHLVDTNGVIVHTWTSNFPAGTAVYVQDDGVLIRAIRSAPFFGVGGIGGGVQRQALDGTLLWDYRHDGPGFVSHHDIEVLPNGNVLLIVWDEMTRQELIDLGRDPATVPAFLTFRPDYIVEIEQIGPTSGKVVWEWHVTDHLIQDFDPTKPGFGVVGDHPELVDINYPGGQIDVFGDWNHSNSIDYDPVHDWIVLSPRAQNEIWVIDHSTTTAEAAGHTGGRWGKGGDLLYRWGNPEAWQAGTALDRQLFLQHSAVVIPEGYPGEGNILVFSNQLPGGGSEVLEIQLPLDPAGNFVRPPGMPFGPAGPVWSFTAPGFDSAFVSGCERHRNGNTLICSGVQGLLFEVDQLGQVVWQYPVPPLVFHAHYVDRTMWASASTFSASAGGTIDFDVIAGTPHAAQAFIVLGSVTGTSPGFVADGMQIDLNVDGWTIFTASFPGTLPLVDTNGDFDFSGRATSSFSIPAGILPAALVGITFDHACVSLDPLFETVSFVSNPVGFEIVP